MASEQAIAKAVTEVMTAAIKAMVADMAQRPQSTAGSKIGRPAMKQPTFNWEADDKYRKIQNLQVRNQ